MAKGIKVHHVTDKELQRMKKEWTRKCVYVWEMTSLLALRDAFGFEAVDMIKFVERLMNVNEDVIDGRLTVKDIKGTLFEETGLKIENGKYSKGDDYMEKSLQSTSALVKEILEKFPATRDNDQILYYRVCEAINEKALTSNFGYVLLHRKDFELPSIETVGRCRRKLQEKNPDLRASSKVEGFRAEREAEFREYAKG